MRTKLMHYSLSKLTHTFFLLAACTDIKFAVKVLQQICGNLVHGFVFAVYISSFLSYETMSAHERTLISRPCNFMQDYNNYNSIH